MKKTKRNIAIIVVLLFVCAAIYFNWSYNTQWGKADAEMAAAEDAATAVKVSAVQISRFCDLCFGTVA